MKNRHLCRICLLLAVWFAVWGFWKEEENEPLLSLLPDGETVCMEGTVYRIEETDSVQRIYLNHISIALPTATVQPENSIVYLNKINAGLAPGNRVKARGVCTWPDGVRNPGCFDAKAYYESMGILFFLRKGEILENDGHIFQVRSALFGIRKFFAHRIQENCDETDAGILKAMLLGDQTGVSEAVEDLYRDAGIIHILAISGLHISMTGMALYGLLRKMRLPFGASAALSGAGVTAYACMTGFRVSAVRAAFMFCFFLLSQATGRTYDLSTALSAAAAVLLAARQKNITQAGFLLSFAALCGVIHAGAWKDERLKGTALGTGLSVQLFTLPLIARFYGQIPLYAIILNLFVIPATPLLMGFGLLGMAASLVSAWLAQIIFAAAHILLKLVEQFCAAFRLLPCSVIITGKTSAARIALYYGAVIAAEGFLQGAFSFKTVQKKIFCAKNIKIDLIKLSFALILLTGIFFLRPQKAFTMTFLDVGQGDGCCVENTDGTVFLIDGGSSSDDDISENCIEPFLKSRGIDTVDFWLVSHYDTDHVNGLIQILSSYKRRLDGKNAAGISIGTLLLPPAEKESKEEQTIREFAKDLQIPVHTLKRGDCLQSGDMTLTVLSPKQGVSYENSNEASVVARIDYGGFSALFTGDLEGEGETDLLREGLLTDVDVLKAAHHGSRYSTSEEFLTLTAPEVSVISCKERNLYGHPHRELLERLQAAGSQIARTDTMGAVIVTVEESGAYSVRTML